MNKLLKWAIIGILILVFITVAYKSITRPSVEDRTETLNNMMIDLVETEIKSDKFCSKYEDLTDHLKDDSCVALYMSIIPLRQITESSDDITYTIEASDKKWVEFKTYTEYQIKITSPNQRNYTGVIEVWNNWF